MQSKEKRVGRKTCRRASGEKWRNVRRNLDNLMSWTRFGLEICVGWDRSRGCAREWGILPGELCGDSCRHHVENTGEHDITTSSYATNEYCYNWHTRHVSPSARPLRSPSWTTHIGVIVLRILVVLDIVHRERSLHGTWLYRVDDNCLQFRGSLHVQCSRID